MAGVPGARCPVAGARCPVSSPLFIYVFFYILIFLRPLHKKASGGLAPNDTLRPQTACTERKQNYSKGGHCRTSTVVVSVPVIGLLGLNLPEPPRFRMMMKSGVVFFMCCFPYDLSFFFHKGLMTRLSACLVYDPNSKCAENLNLGKDANRG